MPQSADCTTLPNPNTTGNNHLDITITDNLSEDTPDVGIAVSGGFKQSDSNTVTATVARNVVRRSGQAGIRVSGGTDSSDSNEVTATLNNNLIARTTKLTSGTAGHGLALMAAAADPSATLHLQRQHPDRHRAGEHHPYRAERY